MIRHSIVLSIFIFSSLLFANTAISTDVKVDKINKIQLSKSLNDAYVLLTTYSYVQRHDVSKLKKQFKAQSFMKIKNDLPKVISKIKDNEHIRSSVRARVVTYLLSAQRSFPMTTLNSITKIKSKRVKTLRPTKVRNIQHRTEPESGPWQWAFMAMGLVAIAGFIGGKLFEGRKSNIIKNAKKVLPENTIAIQIDTKGNVIAFNDRFNQHFSGAVKVGDNWEAYFSKNFFQDTSVSYSYKVFKHKKDVKNDYVITSVKNLSNKRTTFEIVKLNTEMLSTLGKTRIENERHERVSAVSVLEDVLFENIDAKNLIIPQIGNYEDGLLYVGEKQARVFFVHLTKVLKIVGKIHSDFNMKNDVSIDFKRESGHLLMDVGFLNIQLSDDDFYKKVEGLSLVEALAALEDSIKGYNVNTVIKNISKGDTKNVKLTVKVDDLDNVRWTYQSFGLMHENFISRTV